MQAVGEPDAALIEASRRGDALAFARIVERYQRAVYAISFSNVRDHALSDDITQDTFVTAWCRLVDLRDATRLPAWLCGIARNLARDARKRRRREHVGDVGDVEASATPFDALSDAESNRSMTAALERITEKYREPLVLFYYEQRSVEEVARILGISTAATHQRLSRARRQLAESTTEIEGGLARRGPRRELVAAVLAAIGVLSASPDVHASPQAKGSTMTSKLTFVAIITVGAAGVMSADVARSRTRPSAATSSKPIPPSSTANQRPSSPTPAAAPAHGAKRPPPAPIVPTAQPSIVPDCDAVAQHMSELRIAKIDEAGSIPAAKRSAIVASLATDAAKKCIDERWSENVRVCIVDADELERARIDCSDQEVPTREEIAALPSELRCDAVTKHMHALMTGPDGKFTVIKRKLGSPDKLAEVDRLVIQLRDEMLVECEDRPWSIEYRRCIVASKTHRATATCR